MSDDAKIEVGDRMQISVELIRQMAAADPKECRSEAVRVARIDVGPDGIKTLWVTSERDWVQP